MVERCISGHALSALLAWRNPHGTEENWYFNPAQEQGSIFTSNFNLVMRGFIIPTAKVLTAEVGIAVLAVAATTEMVAWGSLTLVSSLFYFYSSQPCKMFYKTFQSSCFTTVWAAADAVYFNLLYQNVITNESIARFYVKESIGLPFVYREEDRFELSIWQHNSRVQSNGHHPMLNSVTREAESLRETILKGSDFLTQEVLKDASENTRTLCRDSDWEIYPFILTRAVAIYAIGDKRNEPVPHFFREDTQEAIQMIRVDMPDGALTQDLMHILRSPEDFNAGTQNPDAQRALTRLRTTGSLELQDSIFMKRCWGVAHGQESLLPEMA